MWVGGPVPSPVVPGGPLPPQAAIQYPEKSDAVTALVFSIIGLIVCQIMCPFAWRMARLEIKAIDAGRRDPKDRGLAVAAEALSIIGTLLVALIVVGVIFVAIGGVVAGA